MDNSNLKKYLAEGKLLKENTNPIWTIGADADDADISDAGLEYIRAVSTIIDKALPDASIEDQIASMEVINNFWHDEARKNAKGSEPEEIKVSAIDFADSVIEHYNDVLMDKDINESQNRMFDFKKYLAEGRLLKEEEQNVLSNYPKYDRNEFKNFKDSLETIIWKKYPLNKDLKSQIPNNLIQVSPDNIETDWARIDYKIIKGDNNLTVRLDNPNYIHWFYNIDDIENLYKTEADKFGFKYKKSPNQGVITLLFTK